MVLFFRYLYYLFLFIFVLFLFLFDQIFFKFYTVFSILYLIVLFPIFDYFFDYIKKDLCDNNNLLYEKIYWLKKYFKEFILVIIFFLIIYFFIWNNYKIFTVSFFITSIFYSIPWKVSFLISFLLLSIVPLYMINNNNLIAENFIVYSMYFLFIWIFLNIFNNIKIYLNNNYFFINISKKVKKIYLKIVFFITNKDSNFIYLLFFLYLILFIFSFYYQNLFIYLKYWFIFLFFIYFILKFFGFTLNWKSIKNWLSINIFISVYIIFLLIISPLIKASDFENKYIILLINMILFLVYILFIWTNIYKNINHFLEKSFYTKTFLSIFLLIFLWWFVFYDAKSKLDEQKTILENKKINRIKEKNEYLLNTKEIVKKTNFKKTDFDTNLYPWSKWEKVKTLQLFLKEKWFFNYKVDWVYDEKTKYWVSLFLSQTCDWDKTNKWLFGPQARDCVISQL